MNSLSAEVVQSLPDEVQQVLQEAQAHINDLETRTAGLTRAFPPKAPKLPDPRTFNGNRNTRALDDYLYDLSQHFENIPEKFILERTKICYAGSFLKDTARLWFQTMDESSTEAWHMYNSFVVQLQSHFGQLDPQSYWLKRWDNLAQKGSLIAYHSDFTAIAAHLSLTPEIKYHHFYKGLKSNILDQLALQPKPKSFDDLVLLANQIDERIYEHACMKTNLSSTRHSSAQRQGPTQRPFNNFSLRPSAPAPSPACWPNNQPMPAPRWTPRPAPQYEPMQVDNIQRCGKPSEAEKQRRRNNNLCLFCAQARHPGDVCPQKHQQPPKQGK